MQEKGNTVVVDVKSCCWEVIVNPNATSGQGYKHWEKIATPLREMSVNFREHIASHAGMGTELVEKLCKEGSRYFMVVGGDGTVNEVVNGIARGNLCKGETFLVPFPVGTGNDWVRTHEYPERIEDILEIFSRGKFKLHDIGFVEVERQGTPTTGRYFINIAGFGFDAAVIARTVNGKAWLGKATYLWNLAKTLFTYRTRNMRVDSDNFHIDSPVFSVTVGICKYNGHGMMQVPPANPFDGLLDVVVISKISICKIIANVKNLFSGKHLKLDEVSVYRTAGVSIKATPYTAGEVEGEILPIGQYRVSVLPAVLHALVRE
ncbi:MAG: diacylglycerol kinase family lipid kinase [Bacteroidales bacterium]|nr:diacylglycerol kinase family lipid kinase [Bacteroidales bacterium]